MDTLKKSEWRVAQTILYLLISIERIQRHTVSGVTNFTFIFSHCQQYSVNEILDEKQIFVIDVDGHPKASRLTQMFGMLAEPPLHHSKVQKLVNQANVKRQREIMLQCNFMVNHQARSLRNRKGITEEFVTRDNFAKHLLQYVPGWEFLSQNQTSNQTTACSFPTVTNTDNTTDENSKILNELSSLKADLAHHKGEIALIKTLKSQLEKEKDSFFQSRKRTVDWFTEQENQSSLLNKLVFDVQTENAQLQREKEETSRALQLQRAQHDHEIKLYQHVQTTAMQIAIPNITNVLQLVRVALDHLIQPSLNCKAKVSGSRVAMNCIAFGPYARKHRLARFFPSEDFFFREFSMKHYAALVKMVWQERGGNFVISPNDSNIFEDSEGGHSDFFLIGFKWKMELYKGLCNLEDYCTASAHNITTIRHPRTRRIERHVVHSRPHGDQEWHRIMTEWVQVYNNIDIYKTTKKPRKVTFMEIPELTEEDDEIVVDEEE